MDELKGIEHSEIYIKNADNVWIGEWSQDAHSQRKRRSQCVPTELQG